MKIHSLQQSEFYFSVYIMVSIEQNSCDIGNITILKGRVDFMKERFGSMGGKV